MDQLHLTARNRILLTETTVDREELARGLQQLGFEVDRVPAGRQAVNRFNPAVHALVLIACEMPGMDGYDATALIRQLEDGGRVPVVGLSPEAGDRDRCLAFGMDDWLETPVTTEALIRMLARWVVREDASDGPSGTAWVDRSRLNDAIGEDPDEVEAVIALYISETAVYLDSVADALAALDSASVARLAHKGAGSSSACGVLGLEGPFRELETQAGRGDLDGMARTLGTLRRRLPVAAHLLTCDVSASEVSSRFAPAATF